MKILKLITLLTFISNFTLAEENFTIIFNEESAKYWQYISDRTMGGISSGRAFIDGDEKKKFARLLGNVSTENNGGFIQLRSRFSFNNFQKEGKRIKGVKIDVKGNGENYHIFIRTDETKSYSDYYWVSFKTNSNWNIIDLPFNTFEHRYSNSLILTGKKINTFAVVAYGRDFNSDISISSINFYY